MSPDRVEQSGVFTPWRDPESGVTSYVLTARVAPGQQSFYFVNSSFTSNGRYLWFYCFFPPGGDHNQGRSLGVVDVEQERLHWFPETAFTDASPMVDLESGEAYWASGLEIWKRSPDPAQPATLVNTFPASVAHDRRPWRLATHLTRSADGMSLLVDAQIGREWYVGFAPLDGSPVRIWQRFDRCYNHAQCNPVDPDLVLLAQDFWYDPVTGDHHDYENRLWLLRRGETARPLYPEDPSRGSGPEPELRTHEWWDRDGRHLWYVNTRRGTERYDVESGDHELVWPSGTWHSQSSQDGRYLVGDALTAASWEQGAATVAFFDTQTRKEVSVASALPPPPGGPRRYHVHPHPQFCLGDRYLCWTTTALDGRVDVALTPVAALRERTA